MTCITSVSDYGAEIWWKGQKSYQDQLQKLQNKALHKILEAFKTSPAAAIKLKVNIESVKVRLNKKCRKYILRVITLSETHSIRQRTSGLSVKQYWIFTDSQMAIQKMQRNNAEMHEILQDLKSIKAEKKTVYINWISSHTQIPENEQAD